MYLAISVFPISMTSGALPPASVASNFCRWVGHVWYCTLTLTPGWSVWNWLFAAATIVRPPVLGVVLQPDGDALGLGRAGDAARGDRKYERGESDEADGDELPSLH